MAAKVPGCVSVVRIHVSMREDPSGAGLEIKGEADARVARGMLALLAKGLRGAGVEQVMTVDARHLITTAKLDQFLPPGRNDGLSSMLAVIKQQAAGFLSNHTCDKIEAPERQGALARQRGDGQVRSGPDADVIEGKDISASNAVSQVWAFGGRAEEVAMLLSGGVDSSVAMALLREQGYKVTAFYLKIWLEDELAHLGECPWQDDWRYASSVAGDLGVPLEAVSLQREYWDQVVKYLIDESARGRTPNPDIMCNSRIKFGMFHDYVGRHFSAIASGHYARQRVCEHGRAQLCLSPDDIKDQTYFLCNMNQHQISHARFPLGGLHKSEVRELAHRYSLATETRKDSQGICFLGKLKFEDFVGHHLGDNPGPVREFATNRVLGEHRGLWFYTIGQRKGLGGATRQFTHEGPWFVAAKDVGSNTLFVTNEYDLIQGPRRAFNVEDINWIAGNPPDTDPKSIDDKLELRVKTRHGPNMHDCTLELSGDTRRQGQVKLAGRDSGLAPGQWAAFYRGEECLGGGVIGESGFVSLQQNHALDTGGSWGASEATDRGENQEPEVHFMEDS